jgi:triacylglycerol lipase
MRTRALAMAWITLVGACSAERSDQPSGESDEVVASSPILAAPEHPRVAKFPFVFVHAFNASSTNDWSFNGVKEALTKDGHYVVLADVPPFAGTPARAAVLAKTIDGARASFCHDVHPEQDESACIASTKVNLVGHSQGGLDARYAASKLVGEHVASITTISSPHHGTPLGDVGVAALQGAAVDVVAERLFALIGALRSPGEAGEASDLRDAFFWLSERRAANTAHDASLEMPDVPGVIYQSWAGVATLDGRLPRDTSACEGGSVLPHAPRTAGTFGLSSAAFFVPLIPVFTRADQIPNDGHIPVASARYGEFQGCLPADHLDLIGRPDGQRDAVIRRTGFDHTSLYRVIADRLAARGL